METTNQERWRQIALAIFSSYVIKIMTDADEKINEQKIIFLAAQLRCDAKSLNSLIEASLQKELSVQDSELDWDIIKKSAKLWIKQEAIVLVNYRFELERKAEELNCGNPNSNFTLNDLIFFIKPIFEEITDEIFQADLSILNV